MSTLVPCPACQMGNHDNHDGSHHGQPGVLGGHICGCRGGCEPERSPLLDALGDAIAGAREVMDMRAPGEAFCLDCPDHEACMTGYPCSLVKHINRVTPEAD